MIAVEGLRKDLGSREVLRGMTFRAEPGSLTLMIGANGSGKTTVLKILAGLLRPDGGSIRIDGRNGCRRHRNRISFLPQGLRFHPRLTCREVLRFYAGIRGVERDRAEAMLVRFGLEDVGGTLTSNLSGGMRQRLGLAVLLLPDVPVYLLDEPGLSLDPVWRREMQEILRKQASRRKTILVTTHLTAEWEGRADRVLICREGRIPGELPPDRMTDDDPFNPHLRVEES